MHWYSCGCVTLFFSRMVIATDTSLSPSVIYAVRVTEIFAMAKVTPA